jgi:hypothetical protein
MYFICYRTLVYEPVDFYGGGCCQELQDFIHVINEDSKK